MVEIETPEYYKIIIDAYVKSSNQEKTPFNPIVMYKIINNLRYLLSIGVIPPINFYNILYFEMEEQEKKGYLITPLLRQIIDNHRQEHTYNFISYIGELAYLQIARQC